MSSRAFNIADHMKNLQGTRTLASGAKIVGADADSIQAPGLLTVAGGGVNANLSTTTGVSHIKMSGTNHTFDFKVVNQPITDSQTGTTPDVANSTSDQLAIYNGVTKLWGISEAGYVLRPNQPSFLVYGAPSKNGNIVYNFQNTDHNIGSHYDNSNGKFTAPISGRYLFCASIWATANSNEYMVFHKNNAETVGAHQGGDSVASSASISTVLNLLAGDFVELICRYSIQSSTPRNNFSGQLLG